MDHISSLDCFAVRFSDLLYPRFLCAMAVRHDAVWRGIGLNFGGQAFFILHLHQQGTDQFDVVFPPSVPGCPAGPLTDLSAG